MTKEFLGGRIKLLCGDCREMIKQLPDASIDAVVTDPPYALVSIVKRFGHASESDDTQTSERVRSRADGYARLTATGFMGKKWDTGEVAFDPALWVEVLRVLKPGGHIAAFGGTRSYHRLACAIEDAGFEIRDCLMWVYASGFPKSHDVSKGIDKSLGLERTKIRVTNPRNPKATGGGRDGTKGATRPWIELALGRGYHEAVSDEAVSWQGWGTALKPAVEPIVLARKPLSEKTVAANVLAHGTGAINIDACRVEGRDSDQTQGEYAGSEVKVAGAPSAGKVYPKTLGRWPANLIHDGSEEVVGAFPDVNTARSTVTSTPGAIYGNGAGLPAHTGTYGFDESGSAARFFYSSKADSDDRLGSKHPTVKPVDLMQYLCRLICPPGGTVLDPFSGTGTTGEAAFREGFNAVLIERELEYVKDIERRMHLVLSGPDERRRETIKKRGAEYDPGPLFGGA